MAIVRMGGMGRTLGVLVLAVACLGTGACRALGSSVEVPVQVTVAGNFQQALGCPGDWQPECGLTGLARDPVDGVWRGRFQLPGGAWEYKAALNRSWDWNYGANATRNGPNIGLSLDGPGEVGFYFSHDSGWITSNRNSLIATAVGDFQAALGCPANWDPTCLKGWLQDPDGDGVLVLEAWLPAGDYQAKVAMDESWAENYGADGVRDGANIGFSVPDLAAGGAEVVFTFEAASRRLRVSPGGLRGDLGLARAHWLSADILAWNPAALPDGAEVRLHADPDAGLALAPGGVSGGHALRLQPLDGGLPEALRARFPHLSGLRAFRLPQGLSAAQLRPLLKGQLAVSAATADGRAIDASGVQLPGVIDELFVFDGSLGPQVSAAGVELAVWAPTAQSVRLLLFDGPDPQATPLAVPMQEDPARGVWTVRGPRDWDRRYYLYEVVVYAPSTRRIEVNRVTDPWSLGLSADSRLSQIVDLEAPDLLPPGWAGLRKPALAAPEDAVVYELHVRDFSIADPSVPAIDRGRFTAFTHAGADGMRHLRRLARAGVSHLHLLPVFDFATVPERESDRREPEGDLAAFPPDSEAQQAAVAAVKDLDGFNWGYDPLHYTVPEGSYATDPDGTARILEFRQMVQALNQAGLRVVVDVVYNHTSAAGQNPRSVLDRVVPGYYHRLNADGFVEMSTCCPNTATEHRMMEKLMLDSVLAWARHYRVDGFRFDLMGHHMKSNMLRVRAALDALAPALDGVDGRAVLLYGEGWDFGEVAGNARGVNASQVNMAGTGIGVFNDRMRDGIRGGTPFGDPREQGLATGLYLAPNGWPQGDARGRLLYYADLVRIGLAGNLAGFEFVNAQGERVRADQVGYGWGPAGYGSDPQEHIAYASAHDNETLFDVVQLKADRELGMAERVRMNMLATSLVVLAQGVPFLHAGDEILRSKSLDRDSFNSGDWFNRIDWTLRTGNWGVGLPPAEHNAHHWPLMRPLLADPRLAPTPADRARALSHAEEMLLIRRSSPLFRLRDAQAVARHLDFHNTGPDQVPGLVVMSLDDPEGRVDRRHAGLVVLFNADLAPVRFAWPGGDGARYRLHPVQLASRDPVVRGARFHASDGAFEVPAQTTAVFVAVRPPAQRLALLLDRLRERLPGHADGGRGRALLAKLEAALRHAEAGRWPAASALLAAAAGDARAVGRDDLDAALVAELEDLAGALISPRG